MSDSTLRQVAQLSKLSFPELQERWRSLFGGEPPAYHRRFLVKRLAYRIQELAYGGLGPSALADMDAILDGAGCDKLGRIWRRSAPSAVAHHPASEGAVSPRRVDRHLAERTAR